jgi:hypothetical protein
MDIDTKERVAEIRRLNTEFRTTFRGGQVLLTANVAALPSADKAAGLQAVAEFNNFNEENDPHKENDYGAFDLSGREWWFKIDYFAPDMEHASEDPANLAKTKRVMTVGLAMDW